MSTPTAQTQFDALKAKTAYSIQEADAVLNHPEFANVPEPLQSQMRELLTAIVALKRFT